MKFWRANKIDGEFDWPVDAVADAFMTHYWTQKLQHAPFPLERMLRNWLTATDGFNSVWEAETGPDSFEALYALVRERSMTEQSVDPGPLRLKDGRAVQPGLYIQNHRALCKVSTLYPGENRVTAQVCFDTSGDPPGRTTVRGLTREELGMQWVTASAQITSRYHRFLDGQR